jgi:hypothetical protein
MRSIRPFLGIAAIASVQGCATLELLGGTCTQEQIVVTWPVSITRDGTTTTPLLTYTLTPSNLDQTQFDRLRQALTSGSASGLYNVVWGIPAFNVNGGYIAFTHAAPMTQGETQQVNTAFTGGGWGAQPITSSFPPAVAVRADNFTAASAMGSINVLASAPLRLRIDVTTANAAGETIRLAGEAGFTYQSVKALCN